MAYINRCSLKACISPPVKCKTRYGASKVRVYAKAKLLKEKHLYSFITLGVSEAVGDLELDDYLRMLSTGVNMYIFSGAYMQIIPPNDVILGGSSGDVSIVDIFVDALADVEKIPAVEVFITSLIPPTVISVTTTADLEKNLMFLEASAFIDVDSTAILANPSPVPPPLFDADGFFL